MFISKIIKQAAACVTAVLGTLTSFTACEDDIRAYYGPAPISPEDAQECCKDLSDMEAIKCLNDYYSNGYCQTQPIATPLYGAQVPSPTETQIEECCGQFTGRSYEACVEDYKTNHRCGLSIPPDAPKPNTPEIPPEDAAQCCKSLQGDAYNTCVSTFKDTGICPVPPDRAI